MKNYDHKKVEKKWQADWEKKKIYQAKNNSKKKKYYSLIEFPYPSGAGLHVGHPRPYIGMDIISRKRRMEGFNVLFPIGWDAFGLPTENYAIKTGIQPQKVTKQNTDNFRRQIKMFGPSFDWSREINTTDPTYYKWTQWIFLQMFKKGLAYKHKSTINWCPSCKIGLANEEAQGGICERCGTGTVKKEKEQWMLAITKYADRLDRDLDLVDYSERIKAQQRNWIGRSEGSEIEFKIKNYDQKIKVFTTRADTLFGATYVVLAPEHELVNKFLNKNKTALILHGTEGNSKKNWYPWLKNKLEQDGYKVIVPDMPKSEFPVLGDWLDCLEKYKDEMDEDSIIIGHSLGCPTAIQFIQKFNKKIDKLILVAPTHKDIDWNLYNKLNPSTNNINIKRVNKAKTDWKKIRTLVNETTSLFSEDDPYIPISVKGFYERDLLSKSIVFKDKGHFNYSGLKRDDFPELLSLIKSFSKSLIQNEKEVEEYIKSVKNKTEIERTDEKKEKTGIELKGVKAINPANNEEIPVWVADYVLAGYGTGAVMAVPAHDERDFEFAKKYDLEIKEVVSPFLNIIDGEFGYKNEKEIVERKGILAIVKHWEKDEYLILESRKHGWKTFVIGGIEEGEDIIEAAKREIIEETGFSDLKFVKKLGGNIFAKHFVPHKDENRFAELTGFYFELKSGKSLPVADHESELQKVLWIKKAEIAETLKPKITDWVFWQRLMNNSDFAFVDDGMLVNSGKFNNLISEEARTKITEFVGGKIVTKYKLRDWIFSRQRYWGEPIPLIHCEKCGWVAVPEKDLPVKLPEVKNYKPTDTGESPLSVISKWVNTKCPNPKCKGYAKRETDTMPNWAGSSWYYLRYTDPKNKKEFANKKILKYWTPVDWYNGGMEHVTLHLLYSRFWHKFLYDLKLVPTKEPYKKRTAHGMVLAANGEKMSKSRGNVVNPDDVIKLYGADTLRIYEMFIGPFADTVAWNDESIIGPRRFIEKVWRISEKVSKNKSSDSIVKLLHKTIKKVEEDIEEMRFNTAVSAMMILATELEKVESINKEDFKKFLQILAPFAPHVAEELWISLGEKKTIHLSSWPKYNKNLIKDDEFKIVIQVNGKVRAEMMVPADETEDKIKEKALKNEQVLKFIENKEIKKVIYVKNRLVNIVV